MDQITPAPKSRRPAKATRGETNRANLAPVLFKPHKQPAKLGGKRLTVVSDYEPAGDQPTAIRDLWAGVQADERDQVLLGVTGSGKTFTMAKLIEEAQRPTLILAPNKTLAAQLYAEMKGFFPNNAVEYFVSYYDYYQPEAYVPRTDTYIEKDSQINEAIDRMRHAATQALLERNDVVIVASVSCIYGIGSVETYSKMVVKLEVGGSIDRDTLARALAEQQYRRNDVAFQRGTFRLRGETVDIFPAQYEDRAWRVSLFGDEIEAISEFDPLTGEVTATLPEISIYANSHYVTPRPTLNQAVKDIKVELKDRLDQFVAEGKLLEAERLQQATSFASPSSTGSKASDCPERLSTSSAEIRPCKACRDVGSPETTSALLPVAAATRVPCVTKGCRTRARSPAEAYCNGMTWSPPSAGDAATPAGCAPPAGTTR